MNQIMERNENNAFQYRYNAKEKQDLESIRKKYLPQDKKEDPMERLYALDRSVTRKPTAFSIALGVIGALIMGSGMSIVMVGPLSLFIIGIVIGVVGMIPIALAYPIYTCVLKKEKARVAPEILRLIEEVSGKSTPEKHNE